MRRRSRGLAGSRDNPGQVLFCSSSLITSVHGDLWCPLPVCPPGIYYEIFSKSLPTGLREAVEDIVKRKVHLDLKNVSNSTVEIC